MLTHFDIGLDNSAGHAVLNIPDAPQTLTLTLRNQGANRLRMTGVSDLDEADQFHVRLRFRPHSLRDLDRIAVAAPSASRWRVVVGVEHDHAQVITLRLMRTLAWNAGETEVVHLTGISAEPRGGTRASLVEASYANFDEQDGDASRPVEGHHLIRTQIARTKAGAFDAARHLRTGSAARFGPVTAGFLDGPAVVSDGESIAQLVLRLVNTSRSPIRLSADDDEASRIELEYRTAAITAPWGLLRGHADHLTATLYQPDETETGQRAAARWTIDGPVIRCIEPHSWAPGEYLDVQLDVHSSAPPGDTQLIVRLVDVPSMDDGELVLLAHVAPLAVFPDSVAAVKPIELWGSSRLEFRPSAYLGRQRPPDEPSTIDVAADGALVIDGRPEVRVPTRLHLTNPSSNEHGEQLVIGPTTGSNLRLGWHDDYSWIQSHGAKQLRINPAGYPVSIGASVKPESGVYLTVRDRIEIHGAKASEQEPRGEREARNHLAMGRNDDHSWIRSVSGPLRINANSQRVSIGPAAVSNDHLLTVGGGMRVIGRPNDGWLLALTRPAFGQVAQTDSLSFGYQDERSFITTPTSGTTLALNMYGGPVVIGNRYATPGTQLTVGGSIHVQNELRIGNWRIVDELDDRAQSVLRVYYGNADRWTDTISAQ